MSARNRLVTCDPAAWRDDLTEAFAAHVLSVAEEVVTFPAEPSRPLRALAADCIEDAYESLCSPDPERRAVARTLVRMVEREGLNPLAVFDA